jgi:isochorismate synthase
MAIAGTQKSLGLDEVIWQKEMEEQQFVTDFILNNLKNLTLK